MTFYTLPPMALLTQPIPWMAVFWEAGVIGLARAFQISGADNVLMSLWNIDDQETVKLMGKFMEIYIKENHATPYEALRQSMVWYRYHEKSQPYYWASFSIFGIP